MIRPRIFVQGVRAPWPVREVQRRWTAAALLVTWGMLGLSTGAQAAQTVRMVCYNIEADVNGVTTPRAGLYTVLEAIGEQPYAGTAAQPLDLLALEETTSNGAATPSPGTGTVGPIVAALNSYYNGAATYALVPYQATEYNNDPTTGDGPNAMVYNTATLTLVYQNGAAAVGVAGTGVKSGGNTVYRQVPRYEFQPVNGAAGTNFYVYVCHMKSGTSSTATNANDRTAEAKAIRADAATLPATANILYMGDFNMDGSAETAYQTLTATSTAAGQGSTRSTTRRTTRRCGAARLTRVSSRSPRPHWTTGTTSSSCRRTCTIRPRSGCITCRVRCTRSATTGRSRP